MKDYISLDDAREAMWRILNGMGYLQEMNERLVEEVDAVLDDYPVIHVRRAEMAEKEYIEREKALAFQNEVEPLLCRNVVTHDIMSATKDADMVKYLQSIPAADVRPAVRAAWEDTPNPQWPAHSIRHCPCCGWSIPKSKLLAKDSSWNYCPNCGADMREES